MSLERSCENLPQSSGRRRTAARTPGVPTADSGEPFTFDDLPVDMQYETIAKHFEGMQECGEEMYEACRLYPQYCHRRGLSGRSNDASVFEECKTPFWKFRIFDTPNPTLKQCEMAFSQAWKDRDAATALFILRVAPDKRVMSWFMSDHIRDRQRYSAGQWVSDMLAVDGFDDVLVEMFRWRPPSEAEIVDVLADAFQKKDTREAMFLLPYMKRVSGFELYRALESIGRSPGHVNLYTLVRDGFDDFLFEWAKIEEEGLGRQLQNLTNYAYFNAVPSSAQLSTADQKRVTDLLVRVVPFFRYSDLSWTVTAASVLCFGYGHASEDKVDDVVKVFEAVLRSRYGEKALREGLNEAKARHGAGFGALIPSSVWSMLSDRPAIVI